MVAGLAFLLRAADQAPPAPLFKSRKLVEASDEYQAAAARALAGFESKKGVARKKLLDALQSGKKQATQAGDLEEANKIQVAIEGLTADEAAAFSPALPRFRGSWTLHFTNGATRVHRMKATGEVDTSEGEDFRTQLERKGVDWILDFPGAEIERASLIGDRLFIEHWSNSQSFPRGQPDILAVGGRSR